MSSCPELSQPVFSSVQQWAIKLRLVWSHVCEIKEEFMSLKLKKSSQVEVSSIVGDRFRGGQGSKGRYEEILLKFFNINQVKFSYSVSLNRLKHGVIGWGTVPMHLVTLCQCQCNVRQVIIVGEFLFKCWIMY